MRTLLKTIGTNLKAALLIICLLVLAVMLQPQRFCR